MIVILGAARVERSPGTGSMGQGILSLMHAIVATSEEGAGVVDEPRITQQHSTFSMTCRVEANVTASAETIWDLLTDAGGFPRWNSTVTGIDGQIRDGEKIRVHAPGTDRTFTPRISDFVADAHMTWTGGSAPMFKGVRRFSLRRRPDGSTDFTMEERFSGLMLPLAKRSMPDFGPVFKQYADDLRREAERISSEEYRESAAAS